MKILEERRKADKLLKKEILEALSDCSDIDIQDVDLEVEDGVVTLWGSVESLYEKMTIEYYVARLLSVAEVENKIEVNRPREGSVEASLSGQDNLILKAPE
ncbi:MAG TPA: BON domain-containing protein [Bacteriovoracaceae bacterium]|nr:BON domain-containing protein [Bacteriovoracaceae bacterium]